MQPMVSRRITELEKKLGAALLYRSTRKVSLTEEGSGYLVFCEKILKDVERAEESIVRNSQNLSGKLRIAVPVSFAVSILAPLMVEFKSQHPDLLIELVVTDVFENLVEEGIDLALRGGQLIPQHQSSLKVIKLADVRHQVCCSPAFLARYGPIEKAEDLQAVPACVYSNYPTPKEWQYTSPDGSEGCVFVAVQMMASNIGVIMQMAVANGRQCHILL